VAFGVYRLTASVVGSDPHSVPFPKSVAQTAPPAETLKSEPAP
jgi:hypothetical protein